MHVVSRASYKCRYQKGENIYFDRKIIHMYILLSLVGIGLLLTLTRQCFHTMLIIVHVGQSSQIQDMSNEHCSEQRTLCSCTMSNIPTPCRRSFYRNAIYTLFSIIII